MFGRALAVHLASGFSGFLTGQKEIEPDQRVASGSVLSVTPVNAFWAPDRDSKRPSARIIKAFRAGIVRLHVRRLYASFFVEGAALLSVANGRPPPRSSPESWWV